MNLIFFSVDRGINLKRTENCVMRIALWQHTLKKLRTLKKILKCVKFGTKSLHFKKNFQMRNFLKCTVT